MEDHRKLLLSINRQIKKLSETEKYASHVELMKSIPGIGLVTAMHFLTEIEDIGRFENTDHFAAYVGIVPGRHDSGETGKDGKMIFRGQPLLKKCIVEASWIAIRNDQALTNAYRKFTGRMEPNKAIVCYCENATLFTLNKLKKENVARLLIEGYLKRIY